MNPRTPEWEQSRVLRHGIPYSSPPPSSSSSSAAGRDGRRGLLFACYQSSIDAGFRKLQEWANLATFGEADTSKAPGVDPIVGQSRETAGGGDVTGDDAIKMWKDDEGEACYEGKDGLGSFAPVVTMRGGEYFFVPSLGALKGVLGSV